MKKIKLVVATRGSGRDFLRMTATGRSWRLQAYNFVELCLFADNRRGLPAVYNEVIRASSGEDCVLVFMHDDLHLLDYHWPLQLLQGLRHFEVLGLAGNVRRLPRQPGWAFANARRQWDDRRYLSGVVAHGQGFPPSHLSVYGPAGRQVKLLDGLLLCAGSQTLARHGLLFDERFDFHFYDMDFCRQAEQNHVRCGTWPLAVVHESGGSFGSAAWAAGYERYLEKWGD